MPTGQVLYKSAKRVHVCTLRYKSRSHLPPVLPGTSLWAEWRRRLRLTQLATGDHPFTFTMLKSFNRIIKDNQRLVREYPSYIIHPFSHFRLHWDVLMFFVLLLHLLTVAFLFGFLPFLATDLFVAWQTFDLSLCLLLTIEFILQFITGYPETLRNEVTLEVREIFHHRMRRCRALYDLLMCIPYVMLLDRVDSWYYEGSPLLYLVFSGYLFLLHILRFQDIHRYFMVLAKKLQLSDKRINVMKLFSGTMYVLHWTACIGHIVTLLFAALSWDTGGATMLKDLLWTQQRSPNGGGSNRAQTMIANIRFTQNTPLHRYGMRHLDDADRSVTATYRYLRSLMVTVKMAVHAGYDPNPGLHYVHDWVECGLMLGGWIWFTYITIAMVHTITLTEIVKIQYEERLNEIVAYCDRERLSAPVERRLMQNLAYRYRNRYYDEDTLIDISTDNLRIAMLMGACTNLVPAVQDILRYTVSSWLVEDMIDQLQFEMIPAGEKIIVAGQPSGDTMFLLAYGTLAVYSPTGKELTHLTDGAHFGQIALLEPNQYHTVTVQAVENCELYRLQREDFEYHVDPYFPLLCQLKSVARRRLQRMRNAIELPEEERFRKVYGFDRFVY